MNTAKTLLIAGAAILLPLMVGGQTAVGQPPQATPDGNGIVVFCEAGEQIAVQSLASDRIYVECVADVEPTPEPTATGEPTPTSTATAVPVDPTATPEPDPPEVSSPFGVYPDCVAPAIPLENHSWWQENGEDAPRHVHIATCLPNARPDGSVTYSGNMPFVARVIMFNNHSELNRLRAGWQKTGGKVNDCPGAAFCADVGDGLSCAPGNVSSEWHEVEMVGDKLQCTGYFEMMLPTDLAPGGGLQEARISPNVEHEDLDTRQFATLNFQIDAGGSGDYRSTEAPIARAWYTGISYCNVSMQNYMDLFASTSQSIPVVSGTIELDIDHSKCGGDESSAGYIDPPFHAHHGGEVVEPVPFYEEDGLFDGIVELDTTELSNGIHTIYLQTSGRDERGLSAGAMAFFINVQN